MRPWQWLVQAALCRFSSEWWWWRTAVWCGDSARFCCCLLLLPPDAEAMHLHLSASKKTYAFVSICFCVSVRSLYFSGFLQHQSTSLSIYLFSLFSCTVVSCCAQWEPCTTHHYSAIIYLSIVFLNKNAKNSDNFGYSFFFPGKLILFVVVVLTGLQWCKWVVF